MRLAFGDKDPNDRVLWKLKTKRFRIGMGCFSRSDYRRYGRWCFVQFIGTRCYIFRLWRIGLQWEFCE